MASSLRDLSKVHSTWSVFVGPLVSESNISKKLTIECIVQLRDGSPCTAFSAYLHRDTTVLFPSYRRGRPLTTERIWIAGGPRVQFLEQAPLACQRSERIRL